MRQLRWTLLDTGLLALLGLAGLGVFLVQSGWHQTSAEQISGETDLAITVWIHNATTLEAELFEVGEETHLSVRKQPRGSLEILKVETSPKEVLIPQANGFKVVEDGLMPNTYDFYITLKDRAMVTTDGYVSNGLKMKIGMPITVEGFSYQLDGRLVKLESLQPDSNKQDTTVN